MDSNKFKYGIVFCGGGAKGAYQIGVWKRLRELGLDKEIVGVSGASIGAMNSMLFAQGNYDIAEEVWRETKESDIKAWNQSTWQSVFQSAVSYGVGKAATGALLTTGLGLANPLFSVVSTLTIGATAINLSNLLKNASCYTPDRLRDMIHKYVSPEGIATTDKQVFTALTAIAAHMPTKSESAMDSFHPACRFAGEIEYRSWAGLTYGQIVETVLASAAFPVAYPASRHNGKVYTDGGFIDNTPVKPLKDAGFRNIVVVHLDYIPNQKKREKKEGKVNSQGSGWVKFMHIWPSASLGDFLKISTDLTQRRINLGYTDTERQLLPLLERERQSEYEHLLQLLPRLDPERLKDAKRHYDLANEIYKRSIRNAVQHHNADMFRNFLKTEDGLTMVRNYEYAADLGYGPAKKMVEQIYRIQKGR